ncbi:MAG: hypothetical protein HY231_25485 [Acidobacteria bacterium]|nr:hypothetical protein [Acidobacteriota bacterium]
MMLRPLTINQKRSMRASLLSLFFLMFMAAPLLVPQGLAGVAKPKGPVYDIVPDNALSTLSAASSRGATFYLQGTIYQYRTFNQGDCTPLFSGSDLQNRVLGTWRAWGTVADSTGKITLHQTLSFDFNATIEVQGVNGLIAPNGAALVADNKGNTTGPSEVLAIVGGSGEFRGLSGEAVVRPYCNPTPAGTNPFRFDRAFCLGVE